MRRVLVLSAVAAMAMVVSCGDDGEGALTRLPEGTFAFLDGRENGELKYPVLELWDIPVCKCDKLITNTPHATRVRVLAKKGKCRPVQYEVEILEGEKAGMQGWVQERFLRFEEGAGPDD